MPRAKRDSWSSRIEFLLACLCFGLDIDDLVGLPYRCYYAGGVYLVLYVILVALIALPLLYMELAVGQLTRTGPIQAIGMLCPLLKGVGISMVITTFFSSTVHVARIALSLHYFFNSFKSPLPWSVCDERWSDSPCDGFQTTHDFTTVQEGLFKNKSVTLSFDYFNNHVFPNSRTLTNWGGLNGTMVGYLFLAWSLCYLCIFRGVHSIGKVVYGTTVLPYIMLCILLIRLVMLPGAVNGFKFFFMSSGIGEYGTLTILFEATRQATYSVGSSFGIMIAFSSFACKRNSVGLSTVFVMLAKITLSLLVGCVVSAALGVHSNMIGVTVRDLATSYGNVYILMPSLLAHLPISNLWAVMYFLMLICLQINFQLSMVHVVMTTIMDKFGIKLTALLRRREMVPLIVCAVTFLCSLVQVTRGWMPVSDEIMYYLVYFPKLIILDFEVLAICLIFGGNRLAREISFLSGHRPWHYFPFTWVWVMPLILTAFSWYGVVTRLKWGISYNLGWWLLTILCLIWIPVGVLHELCKNGMSLMKSVTPTFVPDHVLRKQQLRNAEAGVGESNQTPSDDQPLLVIHQQLNVDNEADSNLGEIPSDVDESEL